MTLPAESKISILTRDSVFFSSPAGDSGVAPDEVEAASVEVAGPLAGAEGDAPASPSPFFSSGFLISVFR